MKRFGIFYGSTTGTTEQIANLIAKKLGSEETDVYDVSKTAPSKVGEYDVILLGASTWGDGDLQDDMHDFLDGLAAIDLKEKYVALFGCGDESMSDTFCNAVGEMYRRILPTGAKIVGRFNADGYDFNHSDADVEGVYVGLVIDNVNHEAMTGQRVQEWADEVKRQTSK